MRQIAATNERQGFARRLADAMEANGCSPRPGDVLMEFNKRAPRAPVTVFAVRKWLKGDSIPTQDKLHVLAAWLNVSAQWLRFGDEAPPADAAHASAETLPPRERRLLADILLLDEPSRKVLEDVLASLLHHLAQSPSTRE